MDRAGALVDRARLSSRAAQRWARIAFAALFVPLAIAYLALCAHIWGSALARFSSVEDLTGNHAWSMTHSSTGAWLELRGCDVTWIVTARRCLLSGVEIFPVVPPLSTSGGQAFRRVAALSPGPSPRESRARP